MLQKIKRYNCHPFFSLFALWLGLFAVIPVLSSCTSLNQLRPGGKSSSPHAILATPVYDFGYAGPEQDISHAFEIKNTGGLPLKIEHVHTECGCTVTSVPQNEIPSGNHDEVGIECETMRSEGDMEKHATVYTNDPENPEMVLTVKGTVKRYTVVIPQGIVFGEVKRGAVVKRSVRIFQLSDNKLHLKKVEANEKFLNIETTWFSEPNKKGFNIEVALKPEVPLGMYTDVITLHTNVKKRPRIDVVVWADVKE